MYDHSEFTTRQLFPGEAVIAAGTATPGAYFHNPRKIMLGGAYIRVAAAGTVTSAAVRLVSIQGTTTTTHGTFAISTATVHSQITASLTSAVAILAGSRLYAEHLLDATLSARVLWEYRNHPDQQPLN
jgi:hypothetical protein